MDDKVYRKQIPCRSEVEENSQDDSCAADLRAAYPDGGISGSSLMAQWVRGPALSLRWLGHVVCRQVRELPHAAGVAPPKKN